MDQKHNTTYTSKEMYIYLIYVNGNYNVGHL